jgi:hypothetical protein
MQRTDTQLSAGRLRQLESPATQAPASPLRPQIELIDEGIEALVLETVPQGQDHVAHAPARPLAPRAAARALFVRIARAAPERMPGRADRAPSMADRSL